MRVALFIVAVMLAAIHASPVADAPYGKHEPHFDKHHVPDHYEELLGRVKIQAYRGPTEVKGDGYHKQYFAPWGHYHTQPKDEKKKKYGYHH